MTEKAGCIGRELSAIGDQQWWVQHAVIAKVAVIRAP
jgi:hypothetical protein